VEIQRRKLSGEASMNRCASYIAVALVWLTASASHAALVEIEITGQLALGGGSDTFNLDGANFTAAYLYDTGATPTNTSTGSGVVVTRFDPILSEVSFTTRPNGASDATVGYQNDNMLLFVRNHFPPESLNDDFRILSGFLSGEFTDFAAATFVFDFGNQTFLAGTSPSPLPLFGSSDVATFTSGVWEDLDEDVDYDSTNLAFTVSTVPIPAAVWLFGSGLGLLGWMRRKQTA
jgi:hypothetical protein